MSDGRQVSRAEGCINVDGQTARAGRLLLAGLGGSVRYKPDGLYQYTQAEMSRRILALIPALWRNWLQRGRALDILITHAPPRGIHDTAHPDSDSAHVGFEAFLPLLRRFRPRYLLHGHSHVWTTRQVTHTRYAATDVINVYPYKIIEIE